MSLILKGHHAPAFFNGRRRYWKECRQRQQARLAALLLAFESSDWQHGIQGQIARTYNADPATICRDMQHLRAKGLIPPRGVSYDSWRLSQQLSSLEQALDTRDAARSAEQIERDTEIEQLRAEVARLRAERDAQPAAPTPTDGTKGPVDGR